MHTVDAGIEPAALPRQGRMLPLHQSTIWDQRVTLPCDKLKRLACYYYIMNPDYKRFFAVLLLLTLINTPTGNQTQTKSLEDFCAIHYTIRVVDCIGFEPI